MASKTIHKQGDGQVTVEHSELPLHVEVSQESHSSELSYEVDTYNISVFSPSLRPEGTAGSEVMTKIFQHTFLIQKLLIEMEHCLIQTTQSISTQQTNQMETIAS